MKSFRLIGIMLLAVTLLVSCGGGDDPVNPDKPVVPEKPDKPDKPTVPSITVPSGEEDYFSKGMTFDTNAGEKNFSFETNSEWILSVALTRSGESWCSVSPTSGKPGKHTVKVKADANTTYDNRQVTLTLTAGSAKKTITITQKQQDALTLTKDKFEIEAKGGKIEVEVKANISYEVIIPEKSKSWISRSTKSRGLTASTLVFDIAESEESEKREGEIIIKSGEFSETVHVYQSGQKILLLSKNEYNIAAQGDTIQVELKSNFDYGVKMPEGDWISEMKNSRAVSSHTLYYIIKANETYDNREAKIVFFDKNTSLADTLHIVQSQKNALIVGQKHFNVKAEGGDIQVKLSSNVQYDVEIKADWITKSVSRGLSEDNLIFTIKPNESNEARTGKIVVTSKDKAITETITVNQSAKGGITITNKHFDVKAEGETIEVEVFTNVNLSVKVNQSWVRQVQSQSSRALDKQVLYFKVDSNESYDSRKAEIELYNEAEGISEKVTINQSQTDALIVGQKEFNVKATGEDIQVKLSSNVEYEIDIKDNWITKTATRGLIEDNLTFSIKPNESVEARTGKIVVTSKDKAITETITVYQLAKENLTIAQRNYSVFSEGETIAVEIESNITFFTKIYATWIKQVSSRPTRTKRTILYFKVADNQSYDSRTASIEFYNRKVGISEKITVYQAQKDALIVNPKSFDVKADGDVIQIKVNKNIDYNIHIEGNWISQTSTRGLVEDVLSFFIKANETTSRRSGKIILSSKDNSIAETIIVNQFGKSDNDNGDIGGTAPDFPWK